MELKNAVVFCGRGKSPKYVEASSIEVINQACIYWDGIKRDNIKFVDENSNYSSSLIQAGDLLINSTGTGTLGRAAVFQGDSNASVVDSHVTVVRLKTEEYLPGFLCYYFRHKPIQERLYSKCVNGSTNQIELSKEKLLHFEIPDLDVEEQTKIFDVLEKVQQLIVMRQKQIDVLDNLIKARFVELFGDLMENPLGWPIKTIADVSTFLKSGLSRKLSDDDIGLPVIRSGNIQDGQFRFDDVKYWYVDDPQGANTKDYILNDGDVLVNFINSASQIGKTAIYRDTGRDCIYTTNIFRMKLADNCDEYYYNWFAMSDYYYRHLQNIIQPAVNQASFTTVNFLKLPILLPTKEKQREFADFVKQVDKSKVAVKKSLDETQKLFDSLMQKYFG